MPDGCAGDNGRVPIMYKHFYMLARRASRASRQLAQLTSPPSARPRARRPRQPLRRRRRWPLPHAAPVAQRRCRARQSGGAPGASAHVPRALGCARHRSVSAHLKAEAFHVPPRAAGQREREDARPSGHVAEKPLHDARSNAPPASLARHDDTRELQAGRGAPRRASARCRGAHAAASACERREERHLFASSPHGFSCPAPTTSPPSSA